MDKRLTYLGRFGSQRRAFPRPPLKIPLIVEQCPLITLLSIVFFLLPTLVLISWIGRPFLTFLSHVLGVTLSLPFSAVFMFALALTLLPPLLLGFSRTSSFTLQCVKWFCDHDQEKSAREFACALDYQIWFRDWKRNPWFRQFVVDSGLLSESPRLARFNRRLGAT